MIEYFTVPLVVYDADGQRKVIGEATVKGTELMAVLSPEAADKLIGMLEISSADFSIELHQKFETKI